VRSVLSWPELIVGNVKSDINDSFLFYAGALIGIIHKPSGVLVLSSMWTIQFPQAGASLASEPVQYQSTSSCAGFAGPKKGSSPQGLFNFRESLRR